MSAFLLICVWEAAIGKPTSLARLLRSDFPLSKELRSELALLIEGKLVAKKHKRGRPKSEEDPSIASANWVFSREYRAIENYLRVANWLRKKKKLYGQGQSLAIAVAKKWELNEETFLNALARNRKPPRFDIPIEHETAKFEQWLARKTKSRNVRK